LNEYKNGQWRIHWNRILFWSEGKSLVEEKGISFFFFYCCVGWGYIVAFTKVLKTHQIYCMWMHPPPSVSLIIPSPHFWISLKIWYHFSIYIHVNSIFAPYLPSTVSPSPYPSYCINAPTPSKTGHVLPSCSLILNKKKRRKWHFWLFKIATQEIACGTSMFICTIAKFGVHLLYFSSFYLSPFGMVVSTSLKILHSFLYREYINYIHLLNFLLLPSPSLMWSPLV
jgi:hypothetical protein